MRFSLFQLWHADPAENTVPATAAGHAAITRSGKTKYGHSSSARRHASDDGGLGNRALIHCFSDCERYSAGVDMPSTPPSKTKSFASKPCALTPAPMTPSTNNSRRQSYTSSSSASLLPKLPISVWRRRSSCYGQPTAPPPHALFDPPEEQWRMAAEIAQLFSEKCALKEQQTALLQQAEAQKAALEAKLATLRILVTESSHMPSFTPKRPPPKPPSAFNPTPEEYRLGTENTRLKGQVADLEEDIASLRSQLASLEHKAALRTATAHRRTAALHAMAQHDAAQLAALDEQRAAADADTQRQGWVVSSLKAQRADERQAKDQALAREGACEERCARLAGWVRALARRCRSLRTSLKVLTRKSQTRCMRIVDLTAAARPQRAAPANTPAAIEAVGAAAPEAAPEAPPASPAPHQLPWWKGLNDLRVKVKELEVKNLNMELQKSLSKCAALELAYDSVLIDKSASLEQRLEAAHADGVALERSRDAALSQCASLQESLGWAQRDCASCEDEAARLRIRNRALHTANWELCTANWELRGPKANVTPSTLPLPLPLLLPGVQPVVQKVGEGGDGVVVACGLRVRQLQQQLLQGLQQDAGEAGGCCKPATAKQQLQTLQERPRWKV